ncbi:cupin domain-containing protein [Lacisediminimonas sp.]|uniref:cupin domain-containing protein n=1 Tax=Lacisediminimonas sp. TaxID=3060582 RepID=UPI00271DCBEA|nr:cupin domain-containing protein [Lacisediminimonas sp.]MDO8300661.1 cupin domain-containing protein [Lacisediminimonas sp.]
MKARVMETAVRALDAEPKTKSSYPSPFAERIVGREKRALGDIFGLKNFGVNLTQLAPGTISGLRHSHSRQDEFIYVLEGHPTLVGSGGDMTLAPGMCAGFPAGAGDAHCIANRTTQTVVYLEVGDRSAGDSVNYPHDDLQAVSIEGGGWVFSRKDGTPY